MPGWFKRAAGFHEENKSALSRDTALDSVRYVVLDTELTSLDHRTNRLLSIGAIAMQGPSIQLGNQFYRVVNPQVSIPAESILIHRLRSEDVIGGRFQHPPHRSIRCGAQRCTTRRNARRPACA